jgi:hypothetical protein
MDDPHVGELIVVARVLALVALLLFVIRASFETKLIGRGTVFGLACVATLVVCPVARACYFVMFLPAIPFVCTRLLELNLRRSAEVFAWVPIGLVWLHYLLLPTSGRVGLMGLGAAAWFLASCVVLQRPSLAPLAIPTERESEELTQPSRREVLVPAL